MHAPPGAWKRKYLKVRKYLKAQTLRHTQQHTKHWSAEILPCLIARAHSPEGMFDRKRQVLKIALMHADIHAPRKKTLYQAKIFQENKCSEQDF
jgi:hypothetical protein